MYSHILYTKIFGKFEIFWGKEKRNKERERQREREREREWKDKISSLIM